MKFQFTVRNQNSQYKEKHSLTNSLNSGVRGVPLVILSTYPPFSLHASSFQTERLGKRLRKDSQNFSPFNRRKFEASMTVVLGNHASS